MQRNESASQRSGSLAALQWSGMETAGIGGVRLPSAASVCDFASVGSRNSKGRSLTRIRPGALQRLNLEGQMYIKALKEWGNMSRFLLISIIVFLVGGYAFHVYMEHQKQRYELQERCGKLAKTVWDKKYNGRNIINTDGDQTTLSYLNHYNAKLNKCFFMETTVETTTLYEGEKLISKRSSRLITLLDLNENKEYGDFLGDELLEHEPGLKLSNGEIILCNVAGNLCHSEIEWDALIKPYMEEPE
jgi:hypothetical protein